jgi:hypothetical protein
LDYGDDLYRKTLVCWEEFPKNPGPVFWSEIKDLITSPEYGYNLKYGAKLRAANVARVMIHTNEPALVMPDKEGRRFAFLRSNLTTLSSRPQTVLDATYECWDMVSKDPDKAGITLLNVMREIEPSVHWDAHRIPVGLSEYKQSREDADELAFKDLVERARLAGKSCGEGWVSVELAQDIISNAGWYACVPPSLAARVARDAGYTDRHRVEIKSPQRAQFRILVNPDIGNRAIDDARAWLKSKQGLGIS